MNQYTVPSGIIAYPSEKGGYNGAEVDKAIGKIIAYPSEKGGYNDTYL